MALVKLGNIKGPKGDPGPRGPAGPQGAQGPEGPAGAASTYVHDQLSAATTWTITHSLGRYPVVSVIDSAGDVVYGHINYVDSNQLTVTFTAAFAGKAYLN